jgi:general secretion pathway protein A
MYQEHFGFLQEPFSIAPDPAFLFLSDAHNEALAHLMYGFSHGGFVLITGEVGTGKTTLLRNLLDRTPPDLDVAFILNPRLTVRELLESLCDELGVVYDKKAQQSVKQYIDVLNKHLLQTHQAGRSTVVIIDEAQNLSPAVLEQIRLLTNLETNDKKLLRIILLGQPELADMLARTELRQLAQRITARYHLTPLSKGDVHAYVSHRLVRAGGNPNIFTKSALNTLYRLSKGTPRLINVIADRALLGAFVEGKYQVTPKLVRNAAKEVLGQSKSPPASYWWVAGVTTAIFAAAGLWFYLLPGPAGQTDVSQSSAASYASVAEPSPADAQEPPAATASAATASAAPPKVQPATTISSLQPTADNGTQPTQSSSTLPLNAPTTADISRPEGRTYVNQRLAYRAVFARWGADYPVNSNLIPCDFAPKVGLQCLSRKGSWSEINALNAPVILELWDNQNAPYYAGLLRSDGSRYELSLGERTTTTTPKDLRDAWFGAYVVLWQTPPDYNGSLSQGDNHPSVRWLHEQLLRLMPEAELGPPQSNFSPALRAAVIAFQQQEGLLADGIVGPLTWIRLSDRLNLPAPKLNS